MNDGNRIRDKNRVPVTLYQRIKGSVDFDKRGNRILETSEHTQENRRTMEWDAANRLASGTRGTDWSLYKSEYTYNGLGLRVNSTIEGPEHTVYDRDYLIDYTSEERNDLAEYNTGHYQWQGTKKVHELKYLYTADGQRLEVDALHYSQWGGENTAYTLNIHEDLLGSATAYTYQGGWNDGQWANKHEFNAWGYNTKSPTYNYDPMYRSTEPYFTGHQFDGSLNIYYADHRFYDAETGTWLSPDPVKDGLNWYQYCGNNPVTYVDPAGLWAQKTVSSMQQQYKVPVIVTWNLTDEGFYLEYADGSTDDFVPFTEMNRQHTTREGVPDFIIGTAQKAIVEDSHTYYDPESGFLRFAKRMNADGTPKMDLIHDYYQVAMGAGMKNKALELLPDTRSGIGTPDGFTFKIVLEDEKGMHYSFDAILTDTKAVDYGMNRNPQDVNTYFPHNNSIEFLNGPINPEWKYNKKKDILLDASITDGQPSMKKIAEREAISKGQRGPEIVQTAEIQLYNRPGLFEREEKYEYAATGKN